MQYYVKDANDTLKYFICGFANENKDCSESNVFRGIKTIKNKAFYLAPNLKRVFFDKSLEIIKQEAFKDCSDLEIFGSTDIAESQSNQQTYPSSSGESTNIAGSQSNQKSDSLYSGESTDTDDSQSDQKTYPSSSGEPTNIADSQSDQEPNPFSSGESTDIAKSQSDIIFNEEYIKKMKKDKKKSLTIETLAFANCENLHTVILPYYQSLKIEKDAFSGCTSLRTVITFAETFSFTENPFRECPKTLVFVCSKDSFIEQFARENGYRSICV